MNSLIKKTIISFFYLLFIIFFFPAASVALTGDLDQDGDVDREDLGILLKDRNRLVSQSSCGSACDLDGDGIITVLDARKLVLLCTLPRCTIVSHENSPPVANAGKDLVIAIPRGQITVDITLDGSASYDPDGNITQYIWTGDINPQDVISPVVSLKQGIYDFTLQVEDDKGESSTDNLKVTVLGQPFLMPVPEVTNISTLKIKGISVPGSTLVLTNLTTGEKKEITNDNELFVIPVGLTEGPNEIKIVARIGDIESSPSKLRVNYVSTMRLYLESISTQQGQSGDIITLRGSGFSPDSKIMGVYFKGTATEGRDAFESRGVVIEATESELKVLIPFIFWESNEEVNVYIYDGQNMSNSLGFHIVPATDPTPDIKGNEVIHQLDLLSTQVQLFYNKLNEWSKPELPEETWIILEENIRRIQQFIDIFKERVNTIPDEDKKSALDAIMGSEFFVQVAQILEDANERLSHTTPCDVAEVIEILRDILELINEINHILDDTKGFLIALITGDSIACFFGCAPCCTTIPFLTNAYSVIAAIDSVIDTIRNVFNTVIDVMLAGIPTIPSEWKVDIKGPFPGINNHILYTDTTSTLRVYANFTNAGFEQLINDMSLRIDIPDPFGLFALLRNFGIDLEWLIEEALGELLIDLAVDLLDIDEIHITFSDINVDSTVIEHTDTSNLISIFNEGVSRKAHRINAHSLTEGSLYQTGIQLDIKSGCGEYQYPTRSKCNQLINNVCMDWGTDYPRFFEIKIVDKPLYLTLPSYSTYEECRDISLCYDWQEGKHLCSLDEYRNAIKQICLEFGNSETFCNEEICYDENKNSYNPICNQDLYYATLSQWCESNAALCDQIVPIKTVCHEFGRWTFEGEGFSTYISSYTYCFDLQYYSCYDEAGQRYLCTPEQYRSFIQLICQGNENLYYCQSALSCYCEECVFPDCSLEEFQDRLDTVCENLSDKCLQYINFTKEECINGPSFKIYWNGVYYPDLLASYETGSFTLYYDLKPGWVSVGISDVAGNERKSVELFVLPDITPQMEIINQDIYPGETLYVAGNFFSTRLSDEQLVLYTPDQTYTLSPNEFSSVGLYTQKDLLIFNDIPDVDEHGGLSIDVRLKVGGYLACGENNCVEDSINILPYEQAGSEATDDQDMVIHGGAGVYNVRTAAIGDLNGDGENDLVIGVTDYQDPESGRSVGAVFIKFGPVTGMNAEIGEKIVQTIDLSAADGGWDVIIVGDPSLIHQDGNTRRIGNSIAIGDLDNDGISDLILGSTDQNESGEHRPNIQWSPVEAPGHIPGSVYIFNGKNQWQRTYMLGEGEYDYKLYADSDDNREFGYQVAVGRITTECQDIPGDGVLCPSGLDLVITAPVEFIEDIYDYDKVAMAYVMRGFNNGLPKEIRIPDDLALFTSYTVITGNTAKQKEVRLLENGNLEVVEYIGDGMGKAVAIGDINGDGLEDLVLGAPQFSSIAAFYPLRMQRGMAYVFYGSPDFGGGLNKREIKIDRPNIISQNLYIIGSTTDGDPTGFGSSVAVVDLNHDGKGEIIVGAPLTPLDLTIYADTTIAVDEQGKFDILFSKAIGALYIIDGAKSQNYAGLQANTQSDLTVHGSFVMTKFGYSLARGDINNDGIQDLLVGAPGREVSKTPGRVWVLYGSNKTLWKTTNDKFDTIHLENRRWYLTTKGFLFNSMDLNTKIPRGTDFVFIGDINNISPVGSGFGIFITVGDLSPFAGDDVIIIDAYGRGPGQDTLDPGPGAAYVFYEHPPVAEISVAPLSIDFGDIITDYYRTQEILIKNTGEANLNIYSINTSGDGSISQTNDCPDILNPKESCIVTVLFSPEIAGIHSGTLTIHSSDPLNERVNVTITGNVITNPDIDVQPQKLIFLDVPLGNKVSKNINITNNGISELHISDILLGSTIHYTQTNNCAVTIAPGETCTITVTYDPVSQVYFTHWADLIIRSDDPDEPEVVVALSGHGIPPFISVEPESINLGAAETNAILSISNTSSSNILSWSITPDLPSWLAVSTTSGETSPSVFERLIVSVDRTGLDAGLYQHNLSITSSGGVVSVPVSMEVSPYISVSPATVDFREAKTRSMITIENTSPTTTISWSINNDLPSWLAVSQGSGILVPGSSIDVYLYADRTGLASDNTYTHILTITSNGGDKTVPVSMTVPVQLATFARYYGDSGSYGGEYFSVVRSTSDGGYIASGLTNSFGADADNPWIVKLDSSGYIQWEYRYPGYGRVYDIKEVSDGGYMVVSSIQYHREFRYFYILRIFKINRYGDMELQKLYDSEIDENMDNWGINFQIVEAVDGGFVIAGNKYVGGRSDFWVLKIDPSGNILWEKTYGGIYDDYANSIDLTSDGGYIVAGVTEVDDTNKTDLWILKIDSSGNIQWQKRYDDRGWNYAYQIKETSEGGYIVVGTTLRTGSAFLLKLDSSGNILWQKSYGEYGSQYYGSYGYSISQTADGGYIMTGVLSNRDGTGDNIWIVRVDQSGDILWQKRYGGDSTDVAYWIEQTIESDYVVAGYTRSFRNTPYGSDNYDAWIMKTDTLGNIGMSCTLIDWTEIVPAESSFVVFETSVIPVDSTSLVIDFPTKPVDTNSTADQICTETVSEAQERDLVDITVEQTSYNFYGVLIGETVSHTFYIKNTGYQPLQINNITLSADQEFSLTHDCPLLLNAANMCRLTVSFTPVTDAEKSGFVSIESDDPDEPVVYINLTGSGYICYECPGEGGGVIFRPP